MIERYRTYILAVRSSDQARPGCFQCKRVKATCRGYRDLQSLIFRDETKSVHRRAGIPTSQASPVPCLISRGLQESEDDIAVAYFHARFVISSDNFSPTQMGFVPHMVYTMEDTLTPTSMICIGMAALTNVKKSPSMALAARRKYIRALSLTSTALSDDISADSKTVLASVLFLAMFEVSSLCWNSILCGWLIHERISRRFPLLATCLLWLGTNILMAPLTF